MVSFCASTAKRAGGCNQARGHSERRFCFCRLALDQSCGASQCKDACLECLLAGSIRAVLPRQRDDQCPAHRLAVDRSWTNLRDPIGPAGRIFCRLRKSIGKQAPARWSFDAELVGSLGRYNRSCDRKIHPLHRGQNLFCIFSKLNLTH